MPAARGGHAEDAPIKRGAPRRGCIPVRYWGDRLGGDDRPERLVTLRMPAVASAATGLPRRCGNSFTNGLIEATAPPRSPNRRCS